MQLVDRVSAPAKVIKKTLGGVNVAAQKLVHMGGIPGALMGGGRTLRSGTYTATGIAAPLGIGVAAAMRSVYKYEKVGNAMQAFGLLLEDQRKNIEEYAQALNKEFPFTNSQILEAAQELFRAGLTYDQAMGALRGTLDLALAGDISNKEATDIATNVMTAMKLPMATLEQVERSMLRVNDALAYAATSSNTDVRLMGDTFRYVAPLAAAAGMELEEVTALAMELARNGIKGSEAGVALRSALVRMAKPTKPMLAAFERMTISIDDFVERSKDIDVDTVIGSLLPSGLDVTALRDELQTILSDPVLKGAPQRMVATLTDAIVKGFGDETLRDEVSSVMQDAIIAGAQKVDLVKLLTVLRDKGAELPEIAQIFDVRMGSRLAAILHSSLLEGIDKVYAEAPGIGAKMADLMMQGIVGDWAVLLAAIENAFISIAESGVLETVSKAFDKLAESINKLSDVNPQILEFGTYAALALVGLAPFSLAVAGLAGSMGLLLSPLGMVVTALGTLAVFKWEGIKAGFKGFMDGLTQNISPETMDRLERVAKAMERLWAAATSDPDTGAWYAWGVKIGEIMAKVADTIEAVISAAETLFDWVGQIQIGAGKIDGAARRLSRTGTSSTTGAESGKAAISEGASSVGTAIQEGFKGSEAGNPKHRKKATGGPLRQGMTYLVGERGPEMITAGRSGYVTPNHKLGGSITMNNTFNVSGVSPQEAANYIGRELRRLLLDSHQSSLQGGPKYG